MTRPAPSCFTQDNTRADGFSGHEIYTQMTGGPGTGSAQNAANKAIELEGSYAGIEARLKRVGETLGESWTGASADAAQAAGNPINQAMIQMQDSLRQADHSLSNQVYQFNYNKAQLKNMPADKPDTNMWDDVTPWDTDTEDAVNSYNSEESHNRKVYSEFQSASNTNRGELPKEFPGVTADNLNVEITNTGGDDGNDKTSNVSNNSTRPSGTPSGFPTSTGSPQGPGGTWTGPGSITGDQTGTSGLSGGDDRPGTGPAKPGELGIGGKPPVGSVIERPPTTGIPPIGVPGGPGLSGTGGGRGTSGTSGGAGGGKFGGGGGSGAGGKFGGGGLGGTGTGGSGTAGQQPGGKSGVFGGMGENAQNAGARGGAAGAAGRGGAAGMGGMGGQGQKGQGEDDLEHKSADYLVTEENTNELIGDMPMVAPPTIGG